MKERTILTSIPVEELQQMISDTVSDAIAKIQFPDASTEHNRFLTKSEISKRLNISLPTVGKYMKSGKLPFMLISLKVPSSFRSKLPKLFRANYPTLISQYINLINFSLAA